MNAPLHHRRVARRLSALFLFSVIAVSGIGYVVGINDGVPREDPRSVAQSLQTSGSSSAIDDSSTAMAAVAYADMRRMESGPTSDWKQTSRSMQTSRGESALQQIPQPKFDLFAEIKPSEIDKQQSTLTRASRRAFNGAPPVIPHAVENTDDAACYACHGKGMRIENRVANRMSHPFLANCTQCHAPLPPKPFADVQWEVANTFVGLKAPLKGERAFPGAPPTIPHSTWMRSECLACHGNEAGWPGLQSTHPWRVNCQQCHAPSAKLEQAISSEVEFLSAPIVNDK